MAICDCSAPKRRAHRGDKRLISHYYIIPVSIFLALLFLISNTGQSKFPALLNDLPPANFHKERSLPYEKSLASNESKQLSSRANAGGDADTPTWAHRVATGSRLAFKY